MRVFIDIGHPAHVHYFKNFIRIMKQNGHVLCFTARDKEMTHYLLKYLNLSFYNRGKGSDSVIGKIMYMLKADFLLLKLAKKFKPDLFLSFGSPYAAHVSSLLRKPHIVFDDTENAKFGQMFYRPFTNHILSPTCFKPNFGQKHIKFEGFMELCYLHPKYFAPNVSVLIENNIKPNEKFVIMRFVSWQANHDIGHTGINLENKILAVKTFSKYAKVYISSEKDLPVELLPYKLNIKPEHIHHVLKYASLVFGESATMASESAVLGTPAIYLDNVGRGYTTEQQEKYGIVYNFKENNQDVKKAIDMGIQILQNESGRFDESRNSMLVEKICMTDFMVWFVENYPMSASIMNENSDYQNQYKYPLN